MSQWPLGMASPSCLPRKLAAPSHCPRETGHPFPIGPWNDVPPPVSPLRCHPFPLLPQRISVPSPWITKMTSHIFSSSLEWSSWEGHSTLSTASSVPSRKAFPLLSLPSVRTDLLPSCCSVVWLLNPRRQDGHYLTSTQTSFPACSWGSERGQSQPPSKFSYPGLASLAQRLFSPVILLSVMICFIFPSLP